MAPDLSETMADVARKIDFDDGSDDRISDEDKACGVEGLRPLPESPEKLKENVMPPVLTREAIYQRSCVIQRSLITNTYTLRMCSTTLSVTTHGL